MWSLRLRTRVPSLLSRRQPTASLSTSVKRFASADLNKAPSSSDSFANGNNAYYAEQMYSLWKAVSRIIPSRLSRLLPPSGDARREGRSPYPPSARSNKVTKADYSIRKLQDSSSVHPSWAVYFSGMDKGMRSEDAFRPPPGLVSLASGVVDGAAPLEFSGGVGTSTVVEDHMKVSRFARTHPLGGPPNQV